MKYSLYIPFISLINILIVAIFYFNKQRIKSQENKIYSALLIANIFGLLLEFLCTFAVRGQIPSDILSMLVLKAYLLYLLTYQILMTIYIYVITRKDQNTDFSLFKNVFMTTTFIVYVISIVFLIVLKLNIYNSGDQLYSYGPATIYLYLLFAFLVIVWIALLIKNRKTTSVFKLIPVLLFITMGMLITAIQLKYPWMILITAGESLITVLMFHTIENPDLKMLRQMEISMLKAERANKAKSDFLSSMSHEIRTPLNAIMSLGAVIITEDNSDQPINTIKEDLKDIYVASEDLLAKVNSILDVQKLETNDFKSENTNYNLRDLIDDLVKANEAKLNEKNLEFRFFYDETIPGTLYGDKNGISQILMNFFTNAVRYTDFGFVELKVHSLQKNDTCQLIISIKDSGKGLSEEKIAKIFDKFERLGQENTTNGGFGLGLAISRRIAELMGGKITVSSDGINKGSMFSYTVVQKIVSSEAFKANTTAIKAETREARYSLVDDEIQNLNEMSEVRPINNEHKKVLVVDDNKLNLKVASRLLKTYELDVTTALSGEECLELLKTNQYDIIYLDIMMPGMDGIEVLNKIRENPNFNTPIVALTADSVPGAEERYLQLGFNAYLDKPIVKDNFEKVIDKYLRN